MKFSLLHPSRSRPNKSFQATQDWLNTCHTKDIELIVSIDDNDPHRDHYLSLYAGKTNTRVISHPNRSAVDAINNAAKVSTGDILIVVSDDTSCIRNWDTVISQAVAGRKDFILKVFDGVQKWIITMPIMDRIYYERFGYIYYPEYLHMFCDTELTHVADITKKVIWRNDIEIKHLHYSVMKQHRDPVYEKNDTTFKQGQKLYIDRFRNKFGLQDVNEWDISGEGHLQWLKRAI